MFKKMQNPVPNATYPHNFKIRISTGPAQKGKSSDAGITKKTQRRAISEDEINRRRKLPREEAKSNVRRLSDRIIYEVYMPEVKSKEDILITKLEDSVEIRAYSKKKCFFKNIPLKDDIIDYYLQNDILFVELKG
jgi:hypothetical protein